MKNKTLSAIFFLSTLSLPTSAAELTLVPSIGFGFSSLNFQPTSGLVDKARFSIVDFALTAAYERYYVRINAEVPLGQETTSSGGIIRQFQREDFGLAVGYILPANFSVFGGISSGKTSIVTYNGTDIIYTRHEDRGPFVGINYNYSVDDNAAISLSLAYAFMDGSYSRFVAGGTSTAETGKTSGLSMGVTWSDRYRNEATYYLSYKYKSYNSVLQTRSINKIFNILTLGFIFPT